MQNKTLSFNLNSYHDLNFPFSFWYHNTAECLYQMVQIQLSLKYLLVTWDQKVTPYNKIIPKYHRGLLLYLRHRAFVSISRVFCTGKSSPDLTAILSPSTYKHEPNTGRNLIKKQPTLSR